MLKFIWFALRLGVLLCMTMFIAMFAGRQFFSESNFVVNFCCMFLFGTLGGTCIAGMRMTRNIRASLLLATFLCALGLYASGASGYTAYWGYEHSSMRTNYPRTQEDMQEKTFVPPYPKTFQKMFSPEYVWRYFQWRLHDDVYFFWPHSLDEEFATSFVHARSHGGRNTDGSLYRETRTPLSVPGKLVCWGLEVAVLFFCCLFGSCADIIMKKRKELKDVRLAAE